MRKRVFNLACLVSAVLAVVILLLAAATSFVNPWDHRVSIGRHFHISVWDGFQGDAIGRIVFFNDAEGGPYRGSLIALEGESLEQLERVSFDWYGIYYRYFHWRAGDTLWTLMISLWYPLLLCLVLPSIWFSYRVRSRAKLDQAA